MKLLTLAVVSIVLSVPPAALAQAQGQVDAKVEALWFEAEPVPAAAAWHDAERQQNSAIVDARFLQWNVPALQRLGRSGTSATGRFSVSFPGFTQPLVLDLVVLQPAYRHLQFEATFDDGSGRFLLVMGRDGTSSAVLETGARSFAIRRAGATSQHVLEVLDHSRDLLPNRRCGTDHSHEVAEPAAAGDLLVPLSTATTTVDVCVFYTSAARVSAGGAAAIEAELALRIANATAACNRSSLKLRYRAVYIGEVNYVETGTTTDLSRFRNTSDGHLDEVHQIRRDYGGDLMVLIINRSTSFCGVAYLMTNLSSNFQASAFSVTARTCLSGHTLTHEIGHNQGCSHDRANAGNAVRPYAYGFRTSDNRFRTIMAYSPGTRVNAWSDPRIQHSGYTMGVVDSEDNARSLDEVRATVSRFAATQVYDFSEVPGGIPGQLGLPTIDGEGTKGTAVPVRVTIGQVGPLLPGALVLGLAQQNLPLFGGTLVPRVDLTLPITMPFAADLVLDGNFLRRLPVGAEVSFQAFFVDAAAAFGFSATNGLVVPIP